jgi:signal peptidase II
VAIPFALVGIADLLSKRAIVASFVPNERRTIVPHVLDLTFVENGHGAMGLFGDRPLLLIAVALVALAALWLALRSSLRHSATTQLAFGAIAGGAIGNVTDRVVHGFVVDFIALPHFFVFNLADIGISAGLALLGFSSLRHAPRVAL